MGGIEVFDELSIASIESVQYLTNLRNLYMDNNQISNLTPISGFTNLSEILLDNNQISDLSALKDFSMPMMGVSMKNQQVNNKPVD